MQLSSIEGKNVVSEAQALVLARRLVTLRRIDLNLGWIVKRLTYASWP